MRRILSSATHLLDPYSTGNAEYCCCTPH